MRKWGSLGTDDGQFENVVGIAINTDDKIYASNSNGDPSPGSHHRIQEFTSLGEFITKWGTAGSGNGEFIDPFDIAFDSQHNVYVADQVNQRIQKFTSDGQFITQWGSGVNPTGIAIDSSDNVFVTEQFDHRVAKFTNNGMLISRWGSQGTHNGQFEYPRGIAIDSGGNVYVTDLIPNTLSYRVQKFTNDGVFLTSWGTLGSGSSPVQFNGYGIAIDPSNNVYVADSFEDKVQKFTNTGSLIAEFGSTGTADGQFNTPHDVALDSSGNVYVADTYNHRIQVFAQHISQPPDTTITSAIDGNGASVQNGGSTSSNQITFQFSASGGTPPITFECSLDNSQFSSCSSPLTYTNLAVGLHTAQFRATDSTALQGPSVSFTWQITAPTPPPDSSCVSNSRPGRIITGTNGDDTLIGSSGADTINGRGGNDGINGCNGADVVDGGNGDDRIAGSQGNDILNGDAGNDVIQGDSGNDQISGGNGNDILTGGPGKDHFNCGAGTDTITDFQPGVDTKTANCENS